MYMSLKKIRPPQYQTSSYSTGECEGAVGSLTWNITSTEGPTLCNDTMIRNTELPLNCRAVTAANISITQRTGTNFFVFNSSLSINLTEGTRVSCKNRMGDSVHDILNLTSE